ncbi:MAG: GNAT family N-acetyltransferase [Candidatus Paceibacterota bacterium]
MPTVSVVTEGSPHLDDVKSLWRRNSQTLGFYPSGAFEERARKRQILGALEGESLVGYVLYYTTKSPSVRITHLCVSESSRGNGVARALVSELQSATKSCRGIGLYCRRDFPAWSLWPRLGFHALNEKIGQSKDGHELTFFWFSHPHKTLFSEYEEADDEKVTLVLDANVFYDLLDAQRMEADESLGLTADWLQPAIHLYVTPELFNEIQRNPDPTERSARMSSARRYEKVAPNHEDFERAVTSVESICGKALTERDKADQRQLAWTIAAGCDVLVTRDRRLLDHSDAFYSEHGVTVERPAEVISRFEEIRNEHEYQRDRVIGTDVHHCRQSSDGNVLAEAFHADSGTEKKGDLARTLNRAFANPDRFSCRVVYGPDGSPLCLYLIEKAEANSCDIRLFRIVRREHGTRLGGTVVRTALATIVKEAAEQGNELVRISDPLLTPAVQQAIRERRFLPTHDGWVKLSLNGVVPLQSVRQRLSELAARVGKRTGQFEEIMDELARRLESEDAEGVLELENIIWPGKISGTSVRSFVVPIRPDWASDLFDGRLAKERLWAADTDLVLNPDSVYYRAAKPEVLVGKGRILWYVSEGSAPGSKMLRACSQLTGVQIGGPKDLFRKYRRFGVYDWRNVLETAKTMDGQLMALEFTNTELFSSPLAWKKLQEVLGRHGKQNYTFPSPVRIDDDLFFDLYKTASSLK